jgi:hypothetical protein
MRSSQHNGVGRRDLAWRYGGSASLIGTVLVIVRLCSCLRVGLCIPVVLFSEAVTECGLYFHSGDFTKYLNWDFRGCPVVVTSAFRYRTEGTSSWGFAGAGDTGVGVRLTGGVSSGKEHCTEMLLRTSI